MIVIRSFVSQYSINVNINFGKYKGNKTEIMTKWSHLDYDSKILIFLKKNNSFPIHWLRF